MTNYGDLIAGTTIVMPFNSNSTGGTPATLSSGAVTITKDGTDVTPSGGVTLTNDVGSQTGYNTVTINTGTDTTTFVAGHEYYVRLGGSSNVGGSSVVGQVIGYFSLQHRAISVATVTSIVTAMWQDLLSSGDFGTASSIGALLKLSLPAFAPNASGGLITIGTGSGQLQPDATGAVPIAFGTALPGAPVANTVGEALFMADTFRGRINTATAGGANTITLDAGAATDANAYVGDGIMLIGGTGGGLPGSGGQRRTIIAYNTSTRVATVDRNWVTPPNNTTTFLTLPVPKSDVYLWSSTTAGTVPPSAATIATTLFQDTTGSDFTTVGSIGAKLVASLSATGGVLAPLDSAVQQSGTAQAGGSTSITLANTALAIDNAYVGALVKVYGVTGAGQTRVITAYVGATRVATVNRAWTTNPDSTSLYAVIAAQAPLTDASLNVTYNNTAPPTAATIAATVWQDLTASGDFSTASSIGALLKTLTVPLTASQVANAVWNELHSAHTTAGTFGLYLDQAISSLSGLSANAIATAVWQDTTAGDFTVSGSVGAKVINSLSASGATLAGTQTYNNTGQIVAPSYYVTPPTAAVIATQIWHDLLSSSDFTTAGSVGALVATLGAAPSAATIQAQMDAHSTVFLDIQPIIDKLGTMLTVVSSNNVFTTTALQNAPSGSGATDWTSTERAQIRDRLGIDGATLVPAAQPNIFPPVPVPATPASSGSPGIPTGGANWFYVPAAGYYSVINQGGALVARATTLNTGPNVVYVTAAGSWRLTNNGGVLGVVKL